MFQAMQLGHAQSAWKDTATFYILSPSAEITEVVLAAVTE